MQAKAQLERAKEDQALTRKRMELEKQRLKVEESRLALFKVIAPFEAVVYRLQVEKGEAVTPNKEALVTLFDMTRLKADIFVPEDILSSLQRGKEYELSINTGGSSMKRQGKLINIDQAVDPASGTARVTFEVDNVVDQFRAGLTVDFTWPQIAEEPE